MVFNTDILITKNVFKTENNQFVLNFIIFKTVISLVINKDNKESSKASA